MKEEKLEKQAVIQPTKLEPTLSQNNQIIIYFLGMEELRNSVLKAGELVGTPFIYFHMLLDMFRPPS